MEQFDIIGPGDQPSLLAISKPEVLSAVKSALVSMGYKVHAVETHEEFEIRYNQINYQVVVVEESFDTLHSRENLTLRLIQNLPMVQRRHAAFFLVGAHVETLNAMEAFALSIHCVINYAELSMLQEIMRKTVADNDLFLAPLREVQRRVFHKPL